MAFSSASRRGSAGKSGSERSTRAPHERQNRASTGNATLHSGQCMKTHPPVVPEHSSAPGYGQRDTERIPTSHVMEESAMKRRHGDGARAGSAPKIVRV